MKEIVLSLVVWLGANTGYVKEVSYPTIIVAQQEELREKLGPMYGNNRILGVYTAHNATIFLDTEVDVSTLRGKSTLLHELVHHYQAKSGRIFSNPCLFEAEAYSIEDKWRRQNDLPESTSHPGFIYWIGKCVMEWEKVR